MNLNQEPVSITEAIRALIVATIGLLTVFNAWNPTPEQVGAVILMYGAFSVVLSSVARQKSTPTENVALTNEEVDALKQMGV